MNLDDFLKPIDTLRSNGAMVHCISNTVAQNFTANVLLACGATPSMTTSIEEVTDFVNYSDAVLVNLGTLDEDRRKVCMLAVEATNAKKIPFVLDPVMCNVSKTRLKFAKEMLAHTPSIIRVNKKEADTLVQNIPTSNQCMAITGPSDLVVHNQSKITIENGHAFMSYLIAVGCAQGAVMAALNAICKNPFHAAGAALLWFVVAGEIAAEKSEGPGSFSSIFIDTLHEISIGNIASNARVK